MPENSMNKKKVLCVYATRQVDSNLLMSSTVFNGLQECGCTVEIVFMGSCDVIDVFRKQYGHYFHKIWTIPISEGWLKRFLRSDRLKVLYSFYLHFLKDGLIRPFRKKALAGILPGDYDFILSFCPPALSGLFAEDVRKLNHLEKIPLVQFWTDPLSLGRCNDISDIPPWRYFHKKLEKRILGLADRAIFCYPLLCEMEQKLHPEFSAKMSWSDVGYIKHAAAAEVPHNEKITIGLFGAYQQRVRNIRPLLAALSYFPEACFIIRGDSDVDINASDYPNLDILPGRCPVKEIEQLEARCDILLCLGNISGIAPPGKFFYYADYHKPIVYIGDGQHKNYFAQYLNGFENRYIVCDNTKEDIVRALRKAMDVLPHFTLHIPRRLEPSCIAAKLFENL